MEDFGRNTSGKPLSSSSWLEAHHQAKLNERRAFASRLARFRPKRLIDLGCATGLWLDLLNDVVDPDCEFIGVDSDGDALEIAMRRAQGWQRPCAFQQGDIAGPFVPGDGDLYLCFNVIGYLAQPVALLDQVEARRRPGGRLVIRQYDGATMRFGPMRSVDRVRMDVSLFAGVGGSTQFRHYELDNTLQAVSAARFPSKITEFELFQRHAPFPKEFSTYLANTVVWNSAHMSEGTRGLAEDWLRSTARDEGAYFVEVDLVATLS
jgi:SAM-dependent methyltransferase